MNRVILVSQYIATGGLERLVVQLAQELKINGGPEPVLFAYENSRTQEGMLAELREAQIAVVHRPKAPGFSFATLFSLLATSIRFRTRILHTHDLGPLIYASLLKLLTLGWIRIIHTQHSDIAFGGNPRHIRYHRFFSRFAKHLVAVSDSVRQSYANAGIQMSIVVITNGIRERIFPCSFADRQRARAQVLASVPQQKDLAAAPRWLLSLGRLSEAKGSDLVVKIWQAVDPKLREGWRLLMIGPEQESGIQARLQQLAGSEASILDATRTPEQWLAAADLYVSASRSEGMPLTPLEALAQNLPVLLSDIPGHQILSGNARFFPLTDIEKAAAIWGDELQKVKKSTDFPDFASEILRVYSLGQTREKYQALYDC